MSGLSLRRGALLIVTAYGLLIAVMAVAVIPQLMQVRRQVDVRRESLLPAQAAVLRVRVSASDQESGERGYLITGDRRFLELFEQGRTDAGEALADLRELDVDALRSHADDIEVLFDRWNREAAAPEIAARWSDDGDEAARLVGLGTGRMLLESLRDKVDEMDAYLVAEIDGSATTLDRAVGTLIALLVVSLVAAVLLTVLVWFQLRRWVTRPVGGILSALRAVSDGDHAHQVPSEGAEELAEIGESADEMRLRMVEDLDEATRAREALEQTGPVVLLLRSELEPEPFDLPDGLSFAGRFHPAEGLLAGDFYDLVPMAHGRLGFVMADVAGHGAEAGVMAVRIKHLMAAALQMAMEPDAVLQWVSVRLGGTNDMFVTAVVVVVDPRTGDLAYANAGHPDLLICEGGELTALGATGPLLGPYPATWGLVRRQIGRRGLVVAYTDGLIEARDPDGEQFGELRLQELVLAHQGDEADVLAGVLIDDVRAFAPGGIADDLTVGVIVVDRPT